MLQIQLVQIDEDRTCGVRLCAGRMSAVHTCGVNTVGVISYATIMRIFMFIKKKYILPKVAVITLYVTNILYHINPYIRVLVSFQLVSHNCWTIIHELPAVVH